MDDCISIRNGYKMTDLYFAEVTKPLEEFECNKNMGDDNISRKAMLEAIDKLTKFVEIWRSDNSTEIVLSENDGCNAIKQLPSAQPEPQWNPYPKRPPKEGREYLITAWYDHEKRYIVTTDDYFSYGWDDWRHDVVAWAELPEPYKGGEDE